MLPPFCYEISLYDNAKSAVVFFVLQAFLAEAMLIMATVIHLGKSGLPTKVAGTFLFHSQCICMQGVCICDFVMVVLFCFN